MKGYAKCGRGEDIGNVRGSGRSVAANKCYQELE